MKQFTIFTFYYRMVLEVLLPTGGIKGFSFVFGYDVFYGCLVRSAFLCEKSRAFYVCYICWNCTAEL